MKQFLRCTLGCLFLSGAIAQAADHQDSPGVLADGRLDLNDIYVFRSPTNTANSVLVMTVNPGAGVLSPTTFNPLGQYQFQVDTNGDFFADQSYEITFGPPSSQNATQSVILRVNGRLLASGKTGANIAIRGGGMLRCDLFEDPFFFDLLGFRAGADFSTPEDFFAGLDVSAIVLELPSKNFGVQTIGVWGRTAVGGTQFDRTAIPALATATIPPTPFHPPGTPSQKNAFNLGIPSNDRTDFGPTVINTIEILSGGDTALATALSTVLLPDISTFDTTSANGFVGTLNGRNLAEDVIDFELNLLTKGAVPGDGIDANDKPFPGVFPYLAPPNAP